MPASNNPQVMAWQFGRVDPQWQIWALVRFVPSSRLGGVFSGAPLGRRPYACGSTEMLKTVFHFHPVFADAWSLERATGEPLPRVVVCLNCRWEPVVWTRYHPSSASLAERLEPCEGGIALKARGNDGYTALWKNLRSENLACYAPSYRDRRNLRSRATLTH